jgi:hypothetical protein
MTAPTTPTKIEKHFYSKQLSAETYYPLNKQGYQLRVSTAKGSTCVHTYCQAVKIENGGESFIMFGDFNKNIMMHREVKRATEKSILESHNKALESIEQVIEEANNFYLKN